MSQVELHVGDLTDMGQRFIGAWHRAEAGQLTEEEKHLTFTTLEGLLATLTPKRLALLRTLHAEPQASVRALAARLQRDYHRVHDDVVALQAEGLVSRRRGRVAVVVDVVRAEVRL